MEIPVLEFFLVGPATLLKTNSNLDCFTSKFAKFKSTYFEEHFRKAASTWRKCAS